MANGSVNSTLQGDIWVNGTYLLSSRHKQVAERNCVARQALLAEHNEVHLMLVLLPRHHCHKSSIVAFAKIFFSLVAPGVVKIHIYCSVALGHKMGYKCLNAVSITV